MGTPNTGQQKANQAAIVASTGIHVESANVIAFSRFVAMVADQACEHGSRNGHITPEAAARCGKVMAEAELDILDGLPVPVEMDAKLAAVAIRVVSVDRFKGRKADGTECGCAFGHRDQAAAQACVGATRRASSARIRASIPVQVAGTLRDAQAPQAKPAETTQPAPKQAETDKPAEDPKPAEAAQPAPEQPKRTRKLRSGSDGNTGRA